MGTISHRVALKIKGDNVISGSQRRWQEACPLEPFQNGCFLSPHTHLALHPSSRGRWGMGRGAYMTGMQSEGWLSAPWPCTRHGVSNPEPRLPPSRPSSPAGEPDLAGSAGWVGGACAGVGAGPHPPGGGGPAPCDASARPQRPAAGAAQEGGDAGGSRGAGAGRVCQLLLA